MPSYTVDVPLTGSVTYTIEADSLEEAREKFLEEYDLDLCIQCSGYASQANGFAVQKDVDLDDVDLDDAADRLAEKGA